MDAVGKVLLLARTGWSPAGGQFCPCVCFQDASHDRSGELALIFSRHLGETVGGVLAALTSQDLRYFLAEAPYE
jgi:hypothetical protein